MAYEHCLQASRFELKYRIDERIAMAMRDFVRSYLERDEYCKPEQKLGYSVQSLYLDSPALILNQGTLDGHKNRFKLRIRFYDDNPDHPAFLEIKRRNTDVILKQRPPVTREGVRRVLKGEPPKPEYLFKDNTAGRSALFNFCRLRDQIRAGGSVFVCYVRDAYVAPNSDAVRLTFDRNIHSRAYTPGNVLVMPPQFDKTRVDNVTLELKFTDRFPHWMRDLVRAFNLQRTSVPKYIECVAAARERPRPSLGR